MRNNWWRLAERTGLKFEAKQSFLGLSRDEKVWGMYRGRPLTLDTFKKAASGITILNIFVSLIQIFTPHYHGGGTTFSPAKFTRIAIGLKPSPTDFLSLRRKRSLSDVVGQPFDRHFSIDVSSEEVASWNVRDQPLDQHFSIDASSEDFASRVLVSASLNERLLEIDGNIRIDGQGLQFEERGVENNIDRLQFLFDLLCDLAEEVERVTVTM